MSDKYSKNDIKYIAEDLVEELRECKDGTVTTTAMLAKKYGYDGMEMEDLFDLHDALFRTVKANKITLDMSEHDGKVEGLPFNLTFIVRNKKAQIKCPHCGSTDTARYLYGYPAFNEEMQKKLDEEKMVLGGCCIDVVHVNDQRVTIMPTRRCNKCKKDFGKPPIHKTRNEITAEDYRDIVESRLLAMLGKSERIFARKCIVVPLDAKDKRLFFEKNHIQGDARSNICYGLQYNGEIVAAMSFGKSRFSDELELVRYANKLNMTVIGGASKLLKHFIRENSDVKRIVSYADRRWSTGNMYEKLGFHMIEKTNPSYFYIVDGRRENRMKYQKHKLVASGEDPAKSEHQIMLEKKIYRIYDCGCLKYEYTI
jgi:hypothetical protein